VDDKEFYAIIERHKNYIACQPKVVRDLDKLLWGIVDPSYESPTPMPEYMLEADSTKQKEE